MQEQNPSGHQSIVKRDGSTLYEFYFESPATYMIEKQLVRQKAAWHNDYFADLPLSSIFSI